jgi:tRNA G18 (ribose-2'-O)-methylase SpoU
MNLTNITNLNIPSLQIYKNLRDNAVTKDNSFIADSPKVVLHLLQSDIEVKSLLATKKFYDQNQELIEQKDIPIKYVAEKSIMKEIVGHNIHHGVMMHGIRPSPSTLEDLGDHIVMLDNISKNENVGVIARSCAALEVDSYIVPNRGPHPFGRKALRVSMGYVAGLKIVTFDDIFETLKSLKELGYKIFAAEVTKDATNLQDIKVPKKWVILMGDEHSGISDEVLALCDEVVKIEMSPDVKSFNVAVASSLMMYHFKNGDHDWT